MLTLVTRVGQLLASTPDGQIHLDPILRLLIPRVADLCLLILQEGSTFRLAAVAHRSPAQEDLIRARWTRRPPVPTPGQWPDPKQDTPLESHPPDDSSNANLPHEEWKALLRDFQAETWRIAPLFTRGQLLGVLVFARLSSSLPFAADQRLVMDDVAGRLAIALDRARLVQMRLERELTQDSDLHMMEVERDRMLQELQETVREKDEALARLNMLLDTAPFGLGFWDRDMRFWRLNRALAEINGLPVEAHIGRTVMEVLPGISKEVVDYFHHMMNTGETMVNVEVSGETPAAPGQMRYWLASYYPIYLRGEIIGLGAIVQEITERKRAEEERRRLVEQIQAERSRFEFLAEASKQLATSLDYATTVQTVARLAVSGLADFCFIDIVDEDGQLERAATAHVAPEKEMLVQALGLDPRVEGQASAEESVLATGEPFFSEQLRFTPQDVVTADDPRYEALAPRSNLIVPLVARGRAIGVISLFTSDSDRRLGPADLPLAEELSRRAALAVDNARLYQEARDALQLRDEFFSVASHELKTPLSTLLITTQVASRLIERGNLDPDKLARHLATIQSQGGKLGSLMSQLLDTSRIQSGKLVLSRAVADVSRLVAEVVEAAQFRTTHHTLRLHTPGPVLAWIDALRLEQVVTNLLDNAIKYSPQGGAIDVELSQPAPHLVRVSVTDYGEGIPLERRPWIFERFYQAHGEGHLGGMGLGLYISRQIAEMHGGSLSVDFPFERGTRFMLTLPVSSEETGQMSA